MGLFGHFFCHLSFLSSFSLSLGDSPTETEILSQKAVKPKTTNLCVQRTISITIKYNEQNTSYKQNSQASSGSMKTNYCQLYHLISLTILIWL